MSTSLAFETTHTGRAAHRGAGAFGLAFLVVAAGACALAGLAPLGTSIVVVFLFAGPHNWMEARFFLSRMPVRWGRLKWFYLVASGGVVLLFAWSLLTPWIARRGEWGSGDWLTGIAVWNSALLLWILVVAELRRRETREVRWPWIWPAGLTALGLNWLWPLAWSLGLVYVHPLIALWFLDRELKRRRPSWLPMYRCCLPAVPLMLAAMWWLSSQAPPLPGDDLISLQIANHAGANILTGVSSRLLVGTHVFLEMLHYAAWIVAIPLIGCAGAPWRLQKIPLVHRSRGWKRVVVGVLVSGGVAALLLWAGFLADYPLTRDVYFSVAVLHVLAEIPFLVRLL